MSEYSYSQIKKEVLSEMLGSWLWDRYRIKPTYRFKYAYYNKINNDVKKKLVEQVLIDILNNDVTRDDIVKYRVAYIASDVGIIAAKPIVEKLVMNTSLRGPCLLLIERAQEKFNIVHNLSYEQIKEIIITLIGEKYGSAYFRGEFPYSFKENYYNAATNVEKKELIKKALMDILTDMSTYTQRHRCYAAYFASIIGLTEAKNIVDKMASDKSITNNKDSLNIMKIASQNFNTE